MSKRLALLIACAAFATVAAAQQPASGPRTVEREAGSDHFAAGCPLRIQKAVAGDLFAASCDLAVEAPVGGNALVAGGNVDLEANVANDVYAAGGRVTVNGPVGRNARIAGGRVQLGPKAAISGNASIAGGEVTLRGAVKGYLHAAGGRVTIDGPVEGDVAVAAGHLDLGPNARIGGKLRFRGEDLQQDPAAQVTGGVEHAPSRARTEDSTRFRRHGGGWIWAAGLMLMAAIIAGALPGASQRMAEELRTHPWRALLFGFIAFVCIPVAAILFMITIIGIPLGLLSILAYAALLLVGYVCAAVALSGAALERFKPGAAALSAWRMGGALLAMLVFALLARIPFLGGLVAIAALFLGVGLILSAAFRRASNAGA